MSRAHLLRAAKSMGSMLSDVSSHGAMAAHSTTAGDGNSDKKMKVMMDKLPDTGQLGSTLSLLLSFMQPTCP